MKFLDRLADRLAALTSGRKMMPDRPPVANGSGGADGDGAPTNDPAADREAAMACIRARLRARAEAGVESPSRYDGPWPLNKVIFRFATLDAQGRRAGIPLTLDDIYKGVWVYGGTGSGKSSGSGVHIAHAMLRAGFGGVVLCDKAEETHAWVRYAQACGRGDDLIVFSNRKPNPERPDLADAYRPKECGFNFLQYELDHAEGSPAQSAVDVLMELLGANNLKSHDEIWQKATRKLLNMCILACSLAKQPVTLKKISDIALFTEEAEKMIEAAYKRKEAKELTESEADDLDVVGKYLAREWGKMAKGPKTSIVMNFGTVLDPFQTGAMRDLFTRKSHQTPDLLLEGKILIVDLPVAANDEAGRAANVAWKYCTQRMVKRRTATDDARPVFIYGDEAQSFISAKDAKFAETARGYRCASVYLTQNRANLLKQMTKDQVDSLMGNFVNKIYHQNSEKETNEWAADTIGKALQVKETKGRSHQSKPGDQGSRSTSVSESAEYQLWPHQFQVLLTGGQQHNYKVTAWLYQGGRKYDSNKDRTFARVVFDQRQIETLAEI